VDPREPEGRRLRVDVGLANHWTAAAAVTTAASQPSGGEESATRLQIDRYITIISLFFKMGFQ